MQFYDDRENMVTQESLTFAISKGIDPRFISLNFVCLFLIDFSFCFKIHQGMFLIFPFHFFSFYFRKMFQRGAMTSPFLKVLWKFTLKILYLVLNRLK